MSGGSAATRRKKAIIIKENHIQLQTNNPSYPVSSALEYVACRNLVKGSGHITLCLKALTCDTTVSTYFTAMPWNIMPHSNVVFLFYRIWQHTKELFLRNGLKFSFYTISTESLP